MRLARTVAALLLAPLALAAAPARSATARPAAPAGRPKLALVLSGGGARGAAHIGALKVLEELHVVPDLIVGTSMGAIVGGLYAAGYSPQEIESTLHGIDWKTVFMDSVKRDEEKSFRRRQDDAIFLVPTRLRFKNWKPYIPPSLLGGQRLELLLRSLEIQGTGASSFDDFPIPFRAVAGDLENGATVILDHGSLAVAMRASISVAGMFPPVEIDGRPLVDGGAVANLPVGIAQRLGADAVIAVDITSPLYSADKLNSVFSILNQMSSFVTYGNRLEDLNRLRPGDVLIQPQLGDITFTDFGRSGDLVGMGEAASRALADKLRRFAVDDAAWASFQSRHHTRPRDELRVDRVRLDNSSWVADEVVERRLEIKTGLPFDDLSTRANIMRLSGLEYFGIIKDDFATEDGIGTLTLTTPVKPYGRSSMQFGVSFADDFEGESSYTLAIRHLLLAANRRGGEWENIAQFGYVGLLRSEFYQPLDYGMKWFVAPWVQARSEEVPLWDDAEVVADFRTKRNEAHLDFGRVLGEWGELRLGPFYGYSSGAVRVGAQIVPDYSEHDAGGRLAFRVDTRDSSIFPRRGALVDAHFAKAFESMGSDFHREDAELYAAIALTAGRVTVLPSIEAGSNIEGPSTVESSFMLGGLLRLSGLGQGELIDHRGGLARVLAYVELSHFDLGALSSSVFAGFSLEAGNVYGRGEAVTLGSLRHGGSLFLGAKTILGPVFLGYGLADGGRDRVYLTIGHRF